ncbi:MAG: LytR/AlgR family response regulator transcription factor [Bacteroidota bacterium]
MNTRCLIIDDEPLSQDILKKFIFEIDRLEITGIFDNALDASNFLRNNKVDLIFLDINMPRLSGIQFFESLKNPPHVIFTTAYPEFAVDGFDLDAIDFLLKPFPFERFFKAVNKVFEKIDNNYPNHENEILWVKSDKKIKRILINKIHFIEAIGDYVRIVTDEGNLVVHDTLQGIYEKLKHLDFERIHRSYIIAMNKINYVEGNRISIGENILPLGQSYRENFLKKLKH